MTDLSPGIVVAERFKLVRKLGEGGMGSVWLAHHVKLDVACAVKFINADVDSGGIRERFEREAKIAAQIRSPNVVHVLDYGVSENQPYIAMELLEGVDLAQRLSDRGRLTPEETVTVVAQVARALTKAHAAGLVHRDLKPENVFLQRDDDTEVVKVLDFGIAKAPMSMSDGNTRTGAVLGTPRYMSPEQAQGLKTLDHRSDLWSLGVIAYRCLVGQLPFDSEAIGDLLMRIIVHPIPVPSQVAPWVSPTFDGWFMRAVARDPAQRFQSAKELADSLSAALGVSVAMSSGRAPGGSMPTIAAAYVPGHTPAPAYNTPAPSYNTPAPSYGTPAPNQTPAPMRTVHETPVGFQAPPGFSPTPNPGGPTPQPINTPWPGQPTTPSAMMAPVPDRTMNPASRTFGAADATKPKSSSKGILIGVVALFGVVIVVLLVMVLGKKGDAVASGAPTATAAPATAAPTAQPVAVEVSPQPDPAAAAAAAAAASAKVATAPAPPKPKPPPVTQPPPPPPPPPPTPVPARTGKVHL